MKGIISGVLIAVTMLVGCGVSQSEFPIIGKWRVTTESSDKVIEQEFTEKAVFIDGSFLAEVARYEIEGEKITVVYTVETNPPDTLEIIDQDNLEGSIGPVKVKLTRVE